MISYGLNGFCSTGDQAMYDALGEAMVAAGDRALTGDQAMYDLLWIEWLLLDCGPGSV